MSRKLAWRSERGAIAQAAEPRGIGAPGGAQGGGVDVVVLRGAGQDGDAREIDREARGAAARGLGQDLLAALGEVRDGLLGDAGDADVSLGVATNVVTKGLELARELDAGGGGGG